MRVRPRENAEKPYSPPPRGTGSSSSGSSSRRESGGGSGRRDAGSGSGGSSDAGGSLNKPLYRERVGREDRHGGGSRESGPRESGPRESGPRNETSGGERGPGYRTWTTVGGDSGSSGRGDGDYRGGDSRNNGDRDGNYRGGHHRGGNHNGGHDGHSGYESGRHRGGGGHGDHHGHGGHSYHRHTRYCGHIGWYGSSSWGYWGSWGGWGYRHHYSPWYWPWWPTVYVEDYGYGEVDDYANGDGWGAIDFDVDPESAQIYLNGEYVGIADDYDGFPTYLWLERGTYDLAVYAEGYETMFRQVSIYPGVVIDMEDSMREGPSTHPRDYGPKSTERRDARIERNIEKEEAARRAEAEAQARAQARSLEPATSRGDVGRLFISVLPADAAVYLDGHFVGTAGEISQLSAGLVVEPGEHVLELVRPGFETLRKTVTVPPGERSVVEEELDED